MKLIKLVHDNNNKNNSSDKGVQKNKERQRESNFTKQQFKKMAR